jgi:hypothetical protein
MAEETQQTIGFLYRLEDFFLYDDQSRWKAIGWIIAIAGSAGTLNLVFLGASVDETVFLMGAIILLMSFAWIAWYCSFRQAEPTGAQFMSRRTLVWQMASFVAFLLSLRLPRAEARVVERRLQEASSNLVSPQNIQETTSILATAKAAGVRIATSTVETTGTKFINASENTPPAWSAALAFLNYRSFLNSSFIANRSSRRWKSKASVRPTANWHRGASQ